jgi:hypothetical protein
VKRGISKKRVEEVMAKKGKLTRWEMLRCRVRFGPKRQTGARPMRHVEADGLTTLRDLRLKPVG